jgi:hypothetical protein
MQAEMTYRINSCAPAFLLGNSSTVFYALTPRSTHPMVHDTATYFGIAGSFVSLTCPIPYGYGIYKRTIRPHLFTWLVWTLVTGIAAAGQFVAGAGPSAWCTAAIGVTCLLTFIASIFRGSPDRTIADWICLVVALTAIPVWRVTHDPTASICLVTFIELSGFMPTIRKTYRDPWGESLIYFGLCILKYFLAVFALDSWSVATALYPTVTCAAAIALCVFIIMRRNVIAKPQKLASPPHSCETGL